MFAICVLRFSICWRHAVIVFSLTPTILSSIFSIYIGTNDVGINCVPGSFIPVSAGETCPYFSFEVPCTYNCDCCNRAANIKYFEIKEQYDKARAAHKKLKARFFMSSK